MPGLSRAFPILTVELTSAGLAGRALGLAGAGAEVGAGPVGVGVPRRSVQRQSERGWRMQARTTVIRTTHPAMGHMRTMGHMDTRRRHTEQITEQLCRHLHRMDHMPMERLDRLAKRGPPQTRPAMRYHLKPSLIVRGASAPTIRRARHIFRPVASACLAHSGRATAVLDARNCLANSGYLGIMPADGVAYAGKRDHVRVHAAHE